jgi:hypothetical protein
VYREIITTYCKNHPAQGRNKWWALVNTAIDTWVPNKAENFSNI